MYSVAALYRFQTVREPETLAVALRAACDENEICGTLIVANEGINGTIAAANDVRMDNILGVIRAHFDALELKMSAASEKPFRRMKVKVKSEIVTMRTPHIDPSKSVGTYVDAKDWNALIADPEVLVIDARNSFEFEHGSFEGAVDPGTKNFGEFPDFVENSLDPAKHKKIAMFCTGGIRCEKASSYLVAKGFKEVYHLKGGILQYLEDVPEAESKWRGRCFVFDERETLGHGLAEKEHANAEG
ncbi:MAG: rhodanese-related sulfurtransferase [Parvibaculum sp.]|nr:rhodanese-related sulfurtransferase [Parvibaculum sp.]MBX3550628.1 rhodanese-related sulfurtransferase [Xanthobacteraceae bacterium]